LEGSTIYTDGWKAYNSLILNGYDYYRIYHANDKFISHLKECEYRFNNRNLSMKDFEKKMFELLGNFLKSRGRKIHSNENEKIKN
jgi:transposase-like protein